MSKLCNFIDGNDRIRDENLRFVKNEFEENINQFFSGGATATDQAGMAAPPRDWIIVQPTPGFCVKSFKINSNEKFFINVCQAPEVPGPKDISDGELISILESTTPGSFRVPMSISEIRHTKDRSNNSVEVCDIAINPKFLTKIKKSQLFNNFFLQIVAEALSEKYNVQITMDKTIILSNRKFIGTLVAHRVRNKDMQRASDAGGTPDAVGRAISENKHTAEPSTSTSTKPSKLIQEIDEQHAATIRNNWTKNHQPLYKLRARIRDENVDEIHAELYLPNCVSSQEFSLDVGEDRILVESLKHGYIFDTFVKYRLNQERAQALFDKTSKMLQIRIPVIHNKHCFVYVSLCVCVLCACACACLSNVKILQVRTASSKKKLVKKLRKKILPFRLYVFDAKLSTNKRICEQLAMDYRYSAYGIGQRRQPNDASSFAPIRGGGGGSGAGGGGGSGNISGNGGGSAVDDNFRRPMNYGRTDSFNNGNSGIGFNNQRFSELDTIKFGNNQRYPDNDNNKFGSMQSNTFGRSNDVGISGGGGGGYSNYSNNNQRFNNSNSHGSVAPIKSSFDDKFRPQQPQLQPQQSQSHSNFLGRSFEPRSNSVSMSGSDNYRGPLHQQQQLPSNLGLTRSISDLNYSNIHTNNNINNKSDNTPSRFYNNDRNLDTFRRSDTFSGVSGGGGGGQDSNHVSRTGSNFKFNNDRPAAPYGRPNNTGNFDNFNDRNFNNDFRGPQPPNDYGLNFDNSKINNSNSSNSSNQQSFYNNNNSQSNGPGNYRGPNNSGSAGNTLAVLETVNALMKNQSNWQVGNNNYGFGPGKPIGGGNRNNKWNGPANISGPPIPKPNQAAMGNRPPFPNQGLGQGQGQGQGRAPRQINSNNINYNNKPQLPNVARNKQFNPQQQQQQPKQQQQQQPKQQQQQQPKQQPQQQPKQQQQQQQKQKQQPQPLPQRQFVNRNVSTVKNVSVNGGKPKPVNMPPKPNAPNAAPNTQAKGINNNSNNNKKEVEAQKPAEKTIVKVGAQKRVAELAPAPLTKADIKRRKLAIKRGFLIGGFKLPYINNLKVALPQPEDKSYAIMFFEQLPNYSTSGEELDDEAMAESQDYEQEGKNAGRTLVKRIRKRLHYEWAIKEEAKKYTSWQSWWTDYKWCEEAIKEELATFGSVNLRNCFIPDLPRLTTEQVVDVIVNQAQFALQKNSDNYFNNMKSIFTLMNITFLENLKMPNTEKVQNMIRTVPNDFWTYKMRSMIYLWAQYKKISKTSSPATETGVKELQAIARDWKNPLFHWIAKQAFDELKAISEVEWPEHKQQYPTLESVAPSSS
ncbi:uncharacterized protein Dmoj_GI17105 [Drosophila mojavensis]|uniref:PIH1 domain-containing protein 1 n=1 Tax=Drosophila mojavensis TaxID=7230 RepID=B4KIM8_DROMO|nr:uncharacterized protein Dmoj_GI17105 [Drosophila mojavensis]